MAVSVSQIFLPKKKSNPKGVSATSTYTGQPDAVLSAQDFRAHLVDIFTDRVSQDSRALLKDLFKYDSDVSASLHAYLTVSNTTPRFFVYDMEGNLDREGQKQFEILKQNLTQKNDYSVGFSFIKSMREISEDLRYMVLLRGGIGAELVFNKFLLPQEIRHVDLSTVEWFEKESGIYKPQQQAPGSNETINLDIANFFVKYYRQNPTEIYSESMFVSAINTIAARQQVINDLYRIMQKTGYPRIEATVVEEVLRKNAPVEMKQDEPKMVQWINSRMQEIANNLTNMRADAAYVHTDAVQAKILNDKGPGSSMDVESIINVLNAQNQAALKVVGTVIGRGESGVNTASVEARIFSLAAESLNGPIADLFSDMFSLALRLTGYQGYVVCRFDPVELRPDTELEPQRVMKQTRLQSDLSLGLITDDEYHLQMYGRPRPDSAPEVSGTGFREGTQNADSEIGTPSPNADPLGRSITPSGSKSANSNTVQKGTR
mgnify:CR=1 FL=1